MKLRTLNEAAAELGVKRERLRRGVAEGRYPFMQWGNRRLVDIDALGPILAAEDEANNTIGITECARRLGLSPDALRGMARRGLVPYERQGKNYRFRLADVEKALEQRMNKNRD